MHHMEEAAPAADVGAWGVGVGAEVDGRGRTRRKVGNWRQEVVLKCPAADRCREPDAAQLAKWARGCGPQRAASTWAEGGGGQY